MAETLTTLVTCMFDWATDHWFLTFLILMSFKGIHLHVGDKKDNNNKK